MVDEDGRHEFTVTGLYDDPLAQETSLVMRVGEQAYLDVYRDGASVPAMAKQLHLSPSTVKTHLEHVYRKLGVYRREELISQVRTDATRKPA